MTVVLVTVAGLSGRRDLVVPAEVPIGDLLGPVAAALAGGDPAVPAAGGGRPDAAGRAGWRLAPLGGDALPPERSLAACGVGDGATLTLTLDTAADALPPPPLAGSVPGASGGASPAIRRATGGGWDAALPAPAAPRGPRGAAPPGPGGAAGRGWSPVGWWRRGPRSHDHRDEPLEAAIAAPRLRRCAVVGVVSAVDGLGRTTVAALLASALAATRDGLTVAVEIRPTPGSRTGRVAPDDGVSAGDLLGLLDHPALTTDELAACLAGRGAGPALVAAASRSPAPAGGGPVAAPLDRRAWTLLVHGLARHAGALVLDCGPGLGGPGAGAVLATADQLVLVTEPVPSPESRRVAGALADLGHAVVVAAGAAAAHPARTGPAGGAPAASARGAPARPGWRACCRGSGGGVAGAVSSGRAAARVGRGPALLASPGPRARLPARRRLARPRRGAGGRLIAGAPRPPSPAPAPGTARRGDPNPQARTPKQVAAAATECYLAPC